MATVYDPMLEYYWESLKSVYGNRKNYYRHLNLIVDREIRSYLISLGCRDNL